MVRFDAIVVGGGVAGSVVARELGLRGLSVALLERMRHPRAKPCGEGLLPHGVAALKAMGLNFPGVPVKGLRYVSPGGTAAQADFPSGPGMVVRREKFDAFLFAAAAETKNVEAHPGTEYDPGRWKARWVIGADGLRSRFHARRAFTATTPRIRRVGLTTHVRGLDVDRDRVEVIFHRAGEIYLAPSDGDTALVACLYRQEDLPPGPSNEERVISTLLSAETLHDRCRRITFATPVLAAGPLGLSVGTIATADTLLVGDAAGAPDPVTGEGMSLAILSAKAAADAIASDRPGDYVKARRRLSAGADWLSAWILRASRHPSILDRLVGSLDAHPDLFKKLIEVATGKRRKGDLTLADLARLAA